MPKRKRPGDLSLQERLDKYSDDVFRALKAAKGFERQRLAKRLRDDGVTPDKQTRLEREVAVLKSLDLHRTARAQLYSSLLKVKPVAESADLPETVRSGVPKPDLPEEDKAALHNVTSGLCRREPVKQAVDRAVVAVCEALNVPLPGKAPRSRKYKDGDKEDYEVANAAPHPLADTETIPADKLRVEEEESEFEGFETDVDEPGPAVGEPESEQEDAEETAFSKYDDLLGGSSEEEEDEDEDGPTPDEDVFARFRGTEQVNLDDISGPSSGSESDVESVAESSASSPSPPPEAKKKDRKTTTKRTAPIRDSTFLPSLMGGYISGSESASDIDAAPRKKRRGQRARQAIWEKKYGAGAAHVQRETRQGGGGASWDARRGAVDGGEDGRRRPARRGGRYAPARRGGGFEPPRERAKPEPKRDDEGTLHPSWAAKKKAEEAKKGASFSGSKITFD